MISSTYLMTGVMWLPESKLLNWRAPDWWRDLSGMSDLCRCERRDTSAHTDTSRRSPRSPPASRGPEEVLSESGGNVADHTPRDTSAPCYCPTPSSGSPARPTPRSRMRGSRRWHYRELRGNIGLRSWAPAVEGRRVDEPLRATVFQLRPPDTDGLRNLIWVTLHLAAIMKPTKLT